MNDNFILQAISSMTVGEAITICLALISILIWIFTFIKKSDTKLAKWYQHRNKRKERVKLIYQTAENLSKLEERHAQDTEMFEAKIDGIGEKIDTLSKGIEEQRAITNKSKQRELRSQIIRDYEYYTSEGKEQWTRRTAEAFWELIDDYEAHGGNGYVHEIIIPAMKQLKYTEVNL